MNVTVVRPLFCLRCLSRNQKFIHFEGKTRLAACVKRKLSTQAAKDEWVKPQGYNTGIMVFNSATNKKEELILPRGKHLSWYARMLVGSGLFCD